jgi:outer membrane immunogenic protein
MLRPIHLVALALLLSSAPLAVRAQAPPIRNDAPPRWEVTLAYSTVRGNDISPPCYCFWMQGGKAEANLAFNNSLSLVGELAGQNVRSINSAHDDLTLVSYLFGPRYSYRRYPRFAPFAQAIFGGVHGFDAPFPPSGSSTTPDAFAFSFGAGVNSRISRHIAIRPFQLDYFQTQLPNDANNKEENLRIGAGITFLLQLPK